MFTRSTMRPVPTAIFALAVILAAPGMASAQTTTSGWNVGLYPVFVWIPTGIDIDVELPPGDGGNVGSIADSRFDGAYLGGFYASKGWFRTDVDMVWAGIGGDRPESPEFSVDLDLIYVHAIGGVRLAPSFYATAGIRRLALDYSVRVSGFDDFERKPGVWDPVVGVGYHLEGAGRPLEVHATFEVGGFGAGTDHEYGAMARIDWKPIRYLGVTAGYSYLRFKLSDTRLDRTFTVRQSLHGPLLGIGVYF